MAALHVSIALALSSVALAQPERLALLPVASQGPDAKLAAIVESALIDAARKVDAVTLVNLDNGKLRAPHTDSKSDTRVRARAQALAREQSAAIAVVAEPQLLGDGAVVYLQVVEATGKVRGSTTAVISAESLSHPAGSSGTAIERALRGGLVQILDPAHYVGRLELRVDVKAAQTEIDGHAAPPAHNGVITLPVGPHAVRVTNPAYHDWLRFVDIAFDETHIEPAALSAFPLTEGEMAEKRKHGGPVITRKLPWYRTWWALTLTGVVVAGATVGIVFGARAGLGYDHEAHYTGGPTP